MNIKTIKILHWNTVKCSNYLFPSLVRDPIWSSFATSNLHKKGLHWKSISVILQIQNIQEIVQFY